MKSKLLLLSFIVAGAVSLGFVKPSKTVATGTLTVKIEMPDRMKDVADADIDIATSEEARDEMEFAYTKTTDKLGTATFTLPEGTYFVDATQVVGEEGYVAETKVTVVAGKTTTITMKLVNLEDWEDESGDEEEE